MSTYVPIQAITLSATASSIEFTGIPQTYTDLVVVLEAKTSALVDTCIRYNGDTGTNYSFTRLFGNGSTASSNRNSSFSRILMGDSDTGAAMLNTIQIQNYSNTTTNKTTLVRSNKTDRIVFAIAALWRNTAAITSMTLFPDSGTWSSGSTFTLYGIGSGSPKAFGGDEVRTDGTYWYHIFRSSGRFEPVQALSNVDFLVIGGGGAGGASVSFGSSGGGGAGGYRTSAGTSGGNSSAESPLSLGANTSYTVTVGAGGAGGTSSNRGNSGSSSTFHTITSDGGGGGGVQGGTSTGGNGGSGGGAAFGSSAGGTATTNQGMNGGSTSLNGRAAGGGGAGQVGTSTTVAAARANGGDGLASTISGTSVTRGGGGGGSTNDSDLPGFGGAGGGGQGANRSTDNAQAGTANTGGGGGGGSDRNPGSGASGGSGIVIIRYGV